MKLGSADLLSPMDYEGPYEHVRFCWGTAYVGKPPFVTILSTGSEMDTKEPYCTREEMSLEKGREFWISLRKQGWIARKSRLRTGLKRKTVSP